MNKDFDFVKQLESILKDTTKHCFLSEEIEYSIDKTDEALTYTFAVPGCEREDLYLSRNGNLLTLKVTPKEDNSFTNKSENGILLSSTIDADKIECYLEHGVLNIILPFKEEISINIS